ncbi:hypothetical protein B0H13DRAFT_2306969 [Mycena leptocephala]|nr:hypothetical protein B0H13DRAFT_2306969 [Mycena leptocephala]
MANSSGLHLDEVLATPQPVLESIRLQNYTLRAKLFEKPPGPLPDTINWLEVAQSSTPPPLHPTPTVNPSPHVLYADGNWLRLPMLRGAWLDVICRCPTTYYRGRYNNRVGTIKGVPHKILPGDKGVAEIWTTEYPGVVPVEDARQILDVPGTMVVVIGPDFGGSLQHVGKRATSWKVIRTPDIQILSPGLPPLTGARGQLNAPEEWTLNQTKRASQLFNFLATALCEFLGRVATASEPTSARTTSPAASAPKPSSSTAPSTPRIITAHNPEPNQLNPIPLRRLTRTDTDHNYLQLGNPNARRPKAGRSNRSNAPAEEAVETEEASDHENDMAHLAYMATTGRLDPGKPNTVQSFNSAVSAKRSGDQWQC